MMTLKRFTKLPHYTNKNTPKKGGVTSIFRFNYSIPNNSTSKTNVDPGPITGPAERSP
jgi:hypothetical protein